MLEENEEFAPMDELEAEGALAPIDDIEGDELAPETDNLGYYYRTYRTCRYGIRYFHGRRYCRTYRQYRRWRRRYYRDHHLEAEPTEEDLETRTIAEPGKIQTENTNLITRIGDLLDDEEDSLDAGTVTKDCQCSGQYATASSGGSGGNPMGSTCGKWKSSYNWCWVNLCPFLA